MALGSVPSSKTYKPTRRSPVNNFYEKAIYNLENNSSTPRLARKSAAARNFVFMRCVLGGAEKFSCFFVIVRDYAGVFRDCFGDYFVMAT